MLKKDDRDRKQNTRPNFCQVFRAHSCPCIFVDTFLDKVFSICSGKDSKPPMLITSISMPQITPHTHTHKEYKICYILVLDKETQPWKKSSMLPAFYHQYALSPIDRGAPPFFCGLHQQLPCGFLLLIISYPTRTIRCFQIRFPKIWHLSYHSHVQNSQWLTIAYTYIKIKVNFCSLSISGLTDLSRV